MSYQGANNTTHYAGHLADGKMSSYPLLFSIWFKLDTVATQSLLSAIPAGDGSGAHYTDLWVSSNKLSLRRRAGATLSDCTHGTTLVTGTWYHGMGWATAAGASVWLNGAGRVDVVSTVNISAPANTWIAGLLKRPIAGNAQPLRGYVAEPAGWEGWTPADLDALAARLAAGGSPMAETIEPTYYHRLRTNNASEPDARGSEVAALAVNGFTFSSDNPTVDDPPEPASGGISRLINGGLIQGVA